VDAPETKYAKTIDGVHIAYQVVGSGPIDVVVVAWGLDVETVWSLRRSGAFVRRLASFSRLILLDRRGTGRSDHVLDRDQQLTLESRIEDIVAVMDAAGSGRAVLMGIEDGGFSVAAMFAATLPERTAGLIGYGAKARSLWAPDYPWGQTPAEYEAEIDEVERGWGTAELARSWADDVYPDGRDDPLEIQEFASWMRSLGGPGDAASWYRVDRDTDIRELLPSIRVPTLMIHRLADRAVPIEHARYITAHIPNAELPSSSETPMGGRPMMTSRRRLSDS
jgi:pimeloyl-ACP methyl ester carboxylesterase